MDVAAVVLVIVALAAVPVYLTGEPAEDGVKSLPDVSKDFMERHEEAAGAAFTGVVVLGVIGYFALASGFLTGKYRSEADFGKSPRGGGMKKYLDGRGLKILAALDHPGVVPVHEVGFDSLGRPFFTIVQSFVWLHGTTVSVPFSADASSKGIHTEIFGRVPRQ